MQSGAHHIAALLCVKSADVLRRREDIPGAQHKLDLADTLLGGQCSDLSPPVRSDPAASFCMPSTSRSRDHAARVPSSSHGESLGTRDKTDPPGVALVLSHLERVQADTLAARGSYAEAVEHYGAAVRHAHRAGGTRRAVPQRGRAVQAARGRNPARREPDTLHLQWAADEAAARAGTQWKKAVLRHGDRPPDTSCTASWVGPDLLTSSESLSLESHPVCTAAAAIVELGLCGGSAAADRCAKASPPPCTEAGGSPAGQKSRSRRGQGSAGDADRLGSTGPGEAVRAVEPRIQLWGAPTAIQRSRELVPHGGSSVRSTACADEGAAEAGTAGKRGRSGRGHCRAAAASGDKGGRSRDIPAGSGAGASAALTSIPECPRPANVGEQDQVLLQTLLDAYAKCRHVPLLSRQALHSWFPVSLFRLRGCNLSLDLFLHLNARRPTSQGSWLPKNNMHSSLPSSGRPQQSPHGHKKWPYYRRCYALMQFTGMNRPSSRASDWARCSQFLLLSTTVGLCNARSSIF